LTCSAADFGGVELIHARQIQRRFRSFWNVREEVIPAGTEQDRLRLLFCAVPAITARLASLPIFLMLSPDFSKRLDGPESLAIEEVMMFGWGG